MFQNPQKWKVRNHKCCKDQWNGTFQFQAAAGSKEMDQTRNQNKQQNRKKINQTHNNEEFPSWHLLNCSRCCSKAIIAWILASKHVDPDPIGKGLKQGPQQPEETGGKCDSTSRNAVTSGSVFRSLGDWVWHRFHDGGCSSTCRSYLALMFCSWLGLSYVVLPWLHSVYG